MSLGKAILHHICLKDRFSHVFYKFSDAQENMTTKPLASLSHTSSPLWKHDFI